MEFPVNDLRHFVWTRRLDGTFFTSFTDFTVKMWDSLSDDPHIIQVWFYTVIWTAAYCDLEFVWQSNLAVTFIESLENFF